MAKETVEVIVTPISYRINELDRKTIVNYESNVPLKSVWITTVGNEKLSGQKIKGRIVGSTMVFDTEDFENGQYVVIAQGQDNDNNKYTSNEFMIWHFN